MTESVNLILPSIAFKLHACGLKWLLDPNWSGGDLYYLIKDHWRDFKKPNDLLIKTHRRGLLYSLGLYFYSEYFLTEEFDYPESLEADYRLFYLEDLLELLKSSGKVDFENKSIKKALAISAQLNSIDMVKEEEKYWELLDKEDVIASIRELLNEFETSVSELAEQYAADYAERVFHDRLFCAFISNLLVAIGLDGSKEDGDLPTQWVPRQNDWPSWVLKAVESRDRGHCAICGVGITLELDAERNIDHIVPLRQGGTNDLSNLQLLCEECNNKKRANLIETKSSIPHYLQMKKEIRKIYS